MSIFHILQQSNKGTIKDWFLTAIQNNLTISKLNMEPANKHG